MSVRSSVPLIDSISDVRLVCHWVRAHAAYIDRQLPAPRTGCRSISAGARAAGSVMLRAEVRGSTQSCFVCFFDERCCNVEPSTVTRSAFDNDECHVTAFRPICDAAHSWSYDNICWLLFDHSWLPSDGSIDRLRFETPVRHRIAYLRINLSAKYEWTKCLQCRVVGHSDLDAFFACLPVDCGICSTITRYLQIGSRKPEVEITDCWWRVIELSRNKS